jgi:tetratricopeptide (TPR) repeat protein
MLLETQNKLAEAELLFREALGIRRAAHDAGHPDIASTLNNLAMLMRAQNKFAEAEPLLREALAIWRMAFSAGHPNIATGLSNLALLLQAQNKFAEAEPLFREALEIRRTALPVGHPDFVVTLNNLASLYAKLGNMDEAEPLIREALTISEKVDPDDWQTFNTKSMLGGALLGRKRYAESEPLLLAGYQGLKQREATIPRTGTICLHQALERLVQLYTDWHAAEPDQGYDAKAAEWQTKLDEHNAALATEKQANAPDK